MKTITKIILAILFFICLLDMPYGFYQFVRFIAFVGFSILAYFAYKENSHVGIVVAIVLEKQTKKINNNQPQNKIQTTAIKYLQINNLYKKIKAKNKTLISLRLIFLSLILLLTCYLNFLILLLILVAYK